MLRTNRGLGAALALVGWVGTVGLGLSGCEGEGGELAVLDMQPRTGTPGGGQAVQIIGNNFRQDIGYTVYFGATRASQVTIMDRNTLIVATPQHEAGSVDVVVAADDGPAFRLREAFAFGTPSAAGAAPSGAPAERF